MKFDGHEVTEISKGFFQIKKPYEINRSEWGSDIAHRGCSAIVSVDSQDNVKILYVSNQSGYVALGNHFAEIMKDDPKIGYLEAIPTGEIMGTVYE